MVLKYVVGVHAGDRHQSVTIEADDALIAGLIAKQQNPAAAITYIRRQNKRGDIRHPHGGVEKPKDAKAKAKR